MDTCITAPRRLVKYYIRLSTLKSDSTSQHNQAAPIGSSGISLISHLRVKHVSSSRVVSVSILK